MARKNVNTMTFAEAVTAWYDTADKYADAGAADSEPRGVFADILEALARDVDDPRVDELIPQDHGRDSILSLTWQLYDGHSQAYFASKELSRQAERVVKVGRRVGQADVRAEYERHYGRLFV